MNFEELLRKNLNAEHPAGRVVAEYRLCVTASPQGVLALVMHPEGFNTDVSIFGVKGDTLVSDAELDRQIRAARDADEAERRAFDEIHAANIAKQRAQQEELRAEEDKRAAEARAAATPQSIAETLPAGDTAPPADPAVFK